MTKLKHLLDKSIQQKIRNHERKTLPNPSNEGVTHHNLNGSSRFEWTRNLYRGAMGLMHKELGEFTSVYGFLMYVVNEGEDESFRHLSWVRAWSGTPRHLNKVTQAMLKDAYFDYLNRHRELRKDFVESELPLDCYYMQGVLPIRPARASWLTEVLTQVRAEMKELVAENNGQMPKVLEPRERADYQQIINNVLKHQEAAVSQEKKPGKKKGRKRKADQEVLSQVTTVEVEGDDLVMTTVPADEGEVDMISIPTEETEVEIQHVVPVSDTTTEVLVEEIEAPRTESVETPVESSEVQ